MNIQINTDNHITGREALAQQAEATVTSALGHLAEHITRVEVHLSDENGNKTGGRDKRCMMEARLEGHQPIAVTDEAETIAQAIDGAADKLKSALDSTLGRLRNYQGREPQPDAPGPTKGSDHGTERVQRCEEGSTRDRCASRASRQA
ncbi:MAG: HPF/RaiA family ribosome-associated protein [Verrucomicrobia bacterium]|nr:HPF/RaiA family ribosome-associated protein [Verrucomicrobiota bacterium]